MPSLLSSTNITLVTSSLTCGGAEKNVAFLASEWARRGARVQVISFDRHPPFFRLDPLVHLITTDITRGYRNLWNDFWTTPARIWKLRQTILETKPDVVISFMDINNLLTLISTVGLGLAVIVAERSDPSIWPTQLGWRLLRRFLYPLAYRVITQTQEAKNYFSSLLRPNIVVIPNPVPAFHFPLNLPNKLDSKRILSIGRLVAMKRFDMLLSAMEVLHHDFPEWTLDILGDGEERQNLEYQAQRLQLNGIVRFHGTVPDTQRFLQNAALFVLCSDFEGFPNALAEAMAAGIPSIATRTQGGKQLIEDHVNGRLIPIGELPRLTSAMKELMQTHEQRTHMSHHALKITEDYSVEKIVEAWEHVLEGV